MKLSEFFAVLDEVSPKTLSDEYCANYGAYDNSGILVDTGEEITGAVFALDLSFKAIARAKDTGANVIVTHHPAIYGKIDGIRTGDIEPLGEKLIACIRNGISVVAMHLNLDTAVDGIDESLCEGVCKACGMERAQNVTVMHPLIGGGYGRVYDVNETALSVFTDGLKRVFQTERLLVYGQRESISRVASFCGAGVDEESITFAIKQGADTIVSSDWKHHLITFATERGLTVVNITHYASEFYGFEKYYKKISQRAGVTCTLFAQRALL